MAVIEENKHKVNGKETDLSPFADVKHHVFCASCRHSAQIEIVGYCEDGNIFLCDVCALHLAKMLIADVEEIRTLNSQKIKKQK